MTADLPNVDVWMLNADLARAPRSALPAGFRMRFYRPGDVETWLGVHALAEQYLTVTAAHFARSMPGGDALLATRVMFLVGPDGAEIGTITAWENDTLLGRRIGQIHWVAIVPEYQGRGLAPPMLSAACILLRAMGHNEACLDTNTRRIPALNLYLRFGFAPHIVSDEQRAAWRAVAPRLRVPLAENDG